MNKRISDFHTHSIFSDASSTVEDIIDRASILKLDAIGITDHFWPSIGSINGGIKLINKRRRIIDDLRSKYEDILILDGAEVDIEPNGMLAPVAGGLEQFDLVIGSVHWGSDSTKWASALLKVLKMKRFDILGHWDGYMSSYRKQDGEIVAAALAEQGVAIELNSKYPLEHPDFLEMARDQGCIFSLGSDAHWLDAVGSVKEQAKLAASLSLKLMDIPIIQNSK